MIEQKTLREIIDAKICRGAFSIRLMMLTISYICFTAIAPNNNIQRKTIKVFVCLFVVYLLYTCVCACVYTVYIIFHILEISLANKSHLWNRYLYYWCIYLERRSSDVRSSFCSVWILWIIVSRNIKELCSERLL